MLANVIVIAVIGGISAVCLKRVIRSLKNGECDGCGGNCSSCGGSCHSVSGKESK